MTGDYELFQNIYLLGVNKYCSHCHRILVLPRGYFQNFRQRHRHVLYWRPPTGLDITSSPSPGPDPEIQKEGAEFPPPPSPSECKLHFAGHAAYSIVSVFVMQSKVTLTFRKIK